MVATDSVKNFDIEFLNPYQILKIITEFSLSVSFVLVLKAVLKCPLTEAKLSYFLTIVPENWMHDY